MKVGQLANYGNVRRMASDDQIFTSFKSIKGTPQYFYSMLLDVLFMQCGLYTVLLTCSEFDQAEIMQVVAHQYGDTLTDKQVNAMDWSTNLKRNPVTVAR